MSAPSPSGKLRRNSSSDPGQREAISVRADSTRAGLSEAAALDFIQRSCELTARKMALDERPREIRCRFAPAFFRVPGPTVGVHDGRGWQVRALKFSRGVDRFPRQ